MYRTNVTKATIDGKVINARGYNSPNEIEVRWDLQNNYDGSVSVLVDSIRVTSCVNDAEVKAYEKAKKYNADTFEVKCSCGKKTYARPGRKVYCQKCGGEICLPREKMPSKPVIERWTSTVYRAYALKQKSNVKIEKIAKWGNYQGRSVRVSDAVYNTAKSIGVTANFSVVA